MLNTRRFLHLAPFAVLVMLLISCPNPIDVDVLNHVKDEFAPVITIISPEEGSYCAKTVVVTGEVTDLSTEEGDEGGVDSLEYSVLNILEGTVDVLEDSSFSFEFSTVNLPSNFTITLTAVDWNSNDSSINLNLAILEGNDIPSFSAESGNHQVTLTWDEVPNTSNYALYYTTEGSQPSEYYGELKENVTSPYTLENLDNGSMHVFRLQAVSSGPDGEDNWSDYIYAIPSSSYTLAPRTFSGTGQIKVTWPEIPAIDEFEVWRSEEKDGHYINISGVRTGNEYIDKQVSNPRGYYYKVKPNLEGTSLSYPNFGNASQFPESFFLSGSLALPAPAYAYDVVVSGKFAYIASGTEGLQIVDISNPLNPRKVRSVPLPGLALGVAVADSYAYIAGQAEGLHIIDISNPATAFLADTEPCAGVTDYFFDVDVAGDYAYLAAKFTGLKIIDVSTIDPETPSANIYTVDTSGTAWGVAVSGDYAYVADDNGGLRIIDITNVLSLSIDDTETTTAYAQDVCIEGGYAYVATDNGLDIIDVSVIDIAPSTNKYFVGTDDSTHHVFVQGGFAYVAADSAGLQIINVADPSTAYLHETIDLNGTARGIAVTEGYAHVAAGNSGLKIVNTENPTSPELMNTVAVNDTAYGVEISGNYAYIADNAAGLQIVDISTPGSESIIKTVNTGGTALEVEISGDYAFIADGTSGLQIIDISEPASAAVITTVGTSNAKGVTVHGDYAFIADWTEGLKIIDISNPESAAILTSVALPNYVSKVNVVNGYAFVMSSILSAPIQVVDVSDPAYAFIETSFNTSSSYCNGITIDGTYAYISTSTGMSSPYGGFEIFDISNPISPVLYDIVTTRLNSGDSGRSSAISGRYAYAAIQVPSPPQVSGFHIIDMMNGGDESDFEDMAVVNYFDEITSSAYDVAVSGQHAYVANGTDGLRIINLLP